MKVTLVVVLVIPAILGVTNKWNDYTGHLVTRARASDMMQLNHLWNLRMSNESLDFWTEILKVGHPVDIHVQSDVYAQLAKNLELAGIKHHIKVADLGRAIEEERQAIKARREMTKDQKAFDFGNYHTYEEFLEYLVQLDSDSDVVEVGSVATTFENRTVIGATISTKSDPRKPMIVIECGVHAHEWAAPSTCLWFINELGTKYGVDDEITRLVDGFDWKIAPLMNPDGYAYTWDVDRYWVKNRRPVGNNCFGVDLYRNFDVGFGGSGSSDVECSIFYHGPNSFSEAESSGIRDVLSIYRDRIKAAVSVHTNSQLWMSPYGYTRELPKDYYPDMLLMMEVGVRAITATYGTYYNFGNHADTLFIASGVTVDHAYDVQGILHSYLLELRDTGEFGVALPIDQLIPTAIETWNGIKAMAFEILRTQ